MPVFSIEGRRILFLHVPKTGGTAISAALRAAGQIRFDLPVRLGGQRLALAQQGINVRAGITHFAEFHGIHPFVSSCLSAEPILARLGKKGNGKEELPLWRKVCQNCKS